MTTNALNEKQLLKDLAGSRRIVMYKDAGNGKTLQWAVTVKKDEIHFTFGQLEGKLQNNLRLAEPKNVGKSNATTGHQQACLESLSLIKKKQDNLYVLKDHWKKMEDRALDAENGVPEAVTPKRRKTGAGIDTEYFKTFRPTLAHDYSGLNKPITFDNGVFTQSKLDGIRNIAAMVDGKVTFQSRNGKANTNLPYLVADVGKILADHPGLILDGELFLKGVDFEAICGSSKRQNKTNLHYHIYDCMDTNNPDATFEQRFLSRFGHLKEIGLVKIVSTFRVTSEDQMREKHAEFVADGMEGLMIRNIASSYEVGKRSRNLLKVKDMCESEDWFIRDDEEASGRDAGSVVFILESDDGTVRFKARPAMTLEVRQHMFEECERDFQNTYYGRRPTIKYQNLSAGNNVPRFPILKCFRDALE